MRECKNLLHLLKYQAAGVFHMHSGMYKKRLFKIYCKLREDFFRVNNIKYSKKTSCLALSFACLFLV